MSESPRRSRHAPVARWPLAVSESERRLYGRPPPLLELAPFPARITRGAGIEPPLSVRGGAELAIGNARMGFRRTFMAW